MKENPEPGPLEGYKQEISDWWTRDSCYYDNYPEHGLTAQEEVFWKQFFIQELGSDPLKILDVGTGTGSLSLLLARIGHQVTGIDLSPGMIAECRRKARERCVPVTLQVGDAEALPFPDEWFDAVTSRWVLWTLLSPDIAVSEWKRVLKPGGSILAFDVRTQQYNTGSTLDKVRRHCSKALIFLRDGRKPGSDRYSPDLYTRLPLSCHKPDAFGKQVELFQSAGFPEVTVKKVEPLSGLSGVKIDKPWRYRLGWKGYGDWHCIISRKGGSGEYSSDPAINTGNREQTTDGS